MNRRVLVAGVAVVALACGLSACGGSDKKVTPKLAATTATTPAVPVQPKGANGVTYDIQNWNDYASDPAVLAWKQTFEAFGASLNAGKVLPRLGSASSKPVLREFASSLNVAKKNSLHVKPIGAVKVQSAKTTEKAATLVMCLWSPTVVYYKKNDKVFGKAEVFWYKQTARLSSNSDRWVLTSYTYEGKCTGGAPE